VLPNIETESVGAFSDPRTLSLDLAHQLAFRRGLGNSLFAQSHSPVSADDVKSFAQQAYAKSNIAVLGGGISSDALSAAVSKAFGSGSAGGSSLNAGSSTYYGGEQRVALDTHANPNARPTMTIAFGSTGSPSADLQVLPHLLGGVSSVKWCAGTSPLSLIAEKVPGATIEAALLPYSDASLFTVTISAPTAEGVKALAKEVASTVKEAASAKGDEVKKAIAKAKLADAARFDNTAGLLSVVASSVSRIALLSTFIADGQIFKGEIPSADSSFASLDKVSADSISKVRRFWVILWRSNSRPLLSCSRASQQLSLSVILVSSHTRELLRYDGSESTLTSVTRLVCKAYTVDCRIGNESSDALDECVETRC